MSFKHGGKGGAIVNVSSAASRLGAPGEYVDYAASKGRDVGRQDAVNALGGEILDGGLLKQNPRIIDQRGQRLAFTIEAFKHRQHLSFITGNGCDQPDC